MENQVKLSVDCYIVNKDTTVWWYLYHHGILTEYLNDENVFFVHQGNNKYLLYCLNSTYETEILEIIGEEEANNVMYLVKSDDGIIKGLFKDKFTAWELMDALGYTKCETVDADLTIKKHYGETNWNEYLY